MKNVSSCASLVAATVLFLLPAVSKSESSIGYAWHIYKTRNYLIAITETCRNGDPECDATYVGTNMQNRSSILLKGKTALRMCQNNPDTPCGVDGLDFKSGSVDYFFVTNGGLYLIVSIKGKQVIREDATLVAEGDGLSGITYPPGPNNNK